MGDLGRGGWSPVTRFSLALGAVLAATALVLAAGTAYLVGRYVEDETTRFTQDAVASHFGSVFSDDVFQRGLSTDERRQLGTIVTFHFSIYNVVATEFFDRTGTIVFSYDADEIGRKLDPAQQPALASALKGMRDAERTTIVADPKLGVPGTAMGYGSYDLHHMVDSTSVSGTTPGPKARELNALEAWIPVRLDGQIVGAVVVWRDLTSIDAALLRIQLTIATIIALAAVMLWLILRGVYVRSSQRIVAQATALEGALVERERTYDATLGALVSALDFRDSETGGHGDRVVAYMDLVLVELGLGGDQSAMLRRGALLHDIGKIGVPDNVLRKPTALSEAEWATMKRHPEFGAKIIAGIPFLEEVARIVRHHHERWDGMGYPDGLKGERIPLGARIFAVGDSFDAMTSDRPYRRAMSIEAARDEVARCAGTQFDPAVVTAFMRIPLERLGAIADDAPHTHPRVVAS
ncbi:MAG TPA: HD domain-containing phosphohydrolase [Candidatus Limnocylindria bacterium]|jgi:putative nucleotidyltransferase with HDIG domain|nr:HD domain-containing phosphohydrolase [Candidatus Limnocylindria bacterium]